MEVFKELCQEDMAVIGQFCAEDIDQCLYSYTKCSNKVMETISNKISSPFREHWS